ncbi:glycosyltransferase [uncultured Propionibacterium sp.]|uniref:glycosyltransferase n=1 Tax=uncultured Propionibacterium sp. TaxID=218066 RepID=UPI00292EA387|nr:glycosyltransferase [uncultured Propionibacterium sp.]
MADPSTADGGPPAPRVVVVVVAWNRAELLERCLDALGAQMRRPDALVVIDNASTDESPRVAADHRAVTEVITLPTNTGGAGGFASGIAVACNRHGADLVWIMDDDTVPAPSALQALLAARDRYPRPVAILASRADWHDGREHPMNTPRARIGARREQRRGAARIGCRPIRSASFVSILIDARAIHDEGLPISDYFLWNDDFEYTTRLLRFREGLYVPASRVQHLTKRFGDTSADPGPRFYQEVRNKVWMFTRSSALAGWERLLYGGSTLRRWAATFRASPDRATLRKGLAEGLRDGLCRGPRSNAKVLAGTPVEADIIAVEGDR